MTRSRCTRQPRVMVHKKKIHQGFNMIPPPPPHTTPLPPNHSVLVVKQKPLQTPQRRTPERCLGLLEGHHTGI
ncbi:hypothetical protein AALO_G00234990 [Alosa alosa]|uniref:Uncharacterized protein n=1 Tax=Alosa alosa TaxID=278164 RepID=A0AAV6FY91_9TELE|nr:hypothetical protein AALO_G00234990 [Alosa alosa]